MSTDAKVWLWGNISTHAHCLLRSASKLFLWIRRVLYFCLTPQWGFQVSHVNGNTGRRVCEAAAVWHYGVLTHSCSQWQQPVRWHHCYRHRHSAAKHSLTGAKLMCSLRWNKQKNHICKCDSKRSFRAMCLYFSHCTNVMARSFECRQQRKPMGKTCVRPHICAATTILNNGALPVWFNRRRRSLWPTLHPSTRGQ